MPIKESSLLVSTMFLKQGPMRVKTMQQRYTTDMYEGMLAELLWRMEIMVRSSMLISLVLWGVDLFPALY